MLPEGSCGGVSRAQSGSAATMVTIPQAHNAAKRTMRTKGFLTVGLPYKARRRPGSVSARTGTCEEGAPILTRRQQQLHAYALERSAQDGLGTGSAT